MTKKVLANGRFALAVEVTDEAPVDIFARAAEPDFPYWNVGPAGERIPMTKAELVSHLAHNILRNGVDDISQLDGFADFPRGAVTMRVVEFEVDNWLADR